MWPCGEQPRSARGRSRSWGLFVGDVGGFGLAWLLYGEIENSELQRRGKKKKSPSLKT